MVEVKVVWRDYKFGIIDPADGHVLFLSAEVICIAELTCGILIAHSDHEVVTFCAYRLIPFEHL